MSAISTPFSAPCAARAVSSVIDYEGLPATKNYYDTLGTVITPKAWQALRGPRRNAHRIPPNTPELIAERAAVIFAAKTATAKEEESARLSAGAWIWIARDDDNAAAAEAVAIAMSSCECTSFTSAPELAKAWNGGELFGPNSKSHAVDPIATLPYSSSQTSGPAVCARRLTRSSSCSATVDATNAQPCSHQRSPEKASAERLGQPEETPNACTSSSS